MPSILDRWWFRAFAAVALFFLCQLGFIISKVQNLDEEKMTLLAEVIRHTSSVSWQDLSSGVWCSSISNSADVLFSLNISFYYSSQIQTLERKRDGLLMDIANKERDIIRLDRKEQQLEIL